jgi:hypothetical protein
MGVGVALGVSNEGRMLMKRARRAQAIFRGPLPELRQKRNTCK